jgi:putative serine protease PepD
MQAPECLTVHAGALLACVMAAGVLGGGTVAGAATFLNASSPAASTALTVEFAPVIINNPESVNAVTVAAQKAAPQRGDDQRDHRGLGRNRSGIILDADGNVLTNMHVRAFVRGTLMGRLKIEVSSYQEDN